MTNLTNEHIDAIYTTTTMIEVACERLSDGNVDDKTAGNLSWLLGSVGEKLSSVVGTIERLKVEQERTERISIPDEVLIIADEVLRLGERLAALRRRPVNSGDCGEN